MESRKVFKFKTAHDHDESAHFSTKDFEMNKSSQSFEGEKEKGTGLESVSLVSTGNLSVQSFGRGSPLLVVVGEDSCSRGLGFESRTTYWMDNFSHYFFVNVILFT